MKKATHLFIYYTVTPIVLFLLLEGASSVVLVAKSIHRTMAERACTKYDEQLGWVNIPNIFIKDMYGKGVYFRTNSQGFRNDADFPASVPDNKIRIVCSGDSFTLGYGVDNNHTWCQLLSSIDSRLETVNMGQGGYGIDQAYLWYMRDGVKLNHHIHLFGIIGSDFYRFGGKFLCYDKPFLKLENGSLVTCNTPVPKRTFHHPWLTENISVLNQLRSVDLTRRIIDKISLGRNNSLKTDEESYSRNTALKIFEELLRINKSKNSVLAVIYLPTLADLHYDNEPFLDLRAFLSSELPKRGIIFVDLVDDFKNLPARGIKKMFIEAGQYSPSAGHYSVEGNEHIANLIYNKLSQFLPSESAEE